MNSATWNNGNPEVFIGKYDYDNNWPLDKNLFTIMYITRTDRNFESNYNNRKFAFLGVLKLVVILFLHGFLKLKMQ